MGTFGLTCKHTMSDPRVTYTAMFFRDRNDGAQYLVSGWIAPAE